MGGKAKSNPRSIPIGLLVDQEVFDKIEELRGREPRSAFVYRKLRELLIEGEK